MQYRDVIASFLLLLVSAYYANSTLFYHQHNVQGQYVFHSHIASQSHKSQPLSDGGHTSAAIKLITALNHVQFEDQVLAVDHVAVERPLECTIVAQSESREGYTLKHRPYLRAPPIDLV